MWLVGFRDLVWRRRRFAVATLAAALVFAITLVLSGLTASLRNETSSAVKAIGADAWVVPAGVSGAFTSTETMPASLATTIASAPGVRGATALVIASDQTVHLPGLADMNVIGYEPGGLVNPPVRSGRAVGHDGEIVVDARLERHIGDHVLIGTHDFIVVGTTKGVSYLGGIGAGFLTLRDAQAVLFSGQPLATTIVTRGVPRSLGPDFRVLDNTQVVSGLRRPVQMASQTIELLDILLWAIAAGIIGAILYVSALERMRDFAVLKAIGSPNRFVLAGLASQAIVVSLLAAAVAIAFSFVLAPLFPMAIAIPMVAYLLLIVVSIVVGSLASVAGLRRALSIDPALAFGG
jgi:putative ABC transport system permease protein